MLSRWVAGAMRGYGIPQAMWAVECHTEEVAARLGISKYSLYEWRKRYGKPAAVARDDDQAAEVRRLKRELQRVTEERDILKKAAAYFAKDAK